MDSSRLRSVGTVALGTLLLTFGIYTLRTTMADTNLPEVTLQHAPSLECFQVHQPVASTLDDEQITDITGQNSLSQTLLHTPKRRTCSQTLVKHAFGNSYGQPYIGSYLPPPCRFDNVVLTLTMESRGRQYDRLAFLFLGDTEVWRTSTAEPTVNGIRWEFSKDMSQYLSLWNEPQNVIFDLPNIVNDRLGLTGVFNVTLTATFQELHTSALAADLIMPISAGNGLRGQGSAFSLPGDKAFNRISLPRNINRAVLSVSACGQAAEEFWWSNVLQSHTHTFESTIGLLYGFSPFREVQIFIDGELAAVHWPYPVVFTGGVVPGLWRPIVGIDAFDLREHEFDISPWLGLLCDGQDHTFEIKVVGINDQGHGGMLTSQVGSSWLVTGKIFLWLDGDPDALTTGANFNNRVAGPSINISSSINRTGCCTNETLVFSVEASREIITSADISTRSGTRHVWWKQSRGYYNHAQLTDLGSTQHNEQSTWALDEGDSAGILYRSEDTYPLTCTQTFRQEHDGNITINATMLLGRHSYMRGPTVFPIGLGRFNEGTQLEYQSTGAPYELSKAKYTAAQINTTQNGTAWYAASPNRNVSRGFGATDQLFSFRVFTEYGTSKELYFRAVNASQGRIVHDREELSGEAQKEYGEGFVSAEDGMEDTGFAIPRKFYRVS